MIMLRHGGNRHTVTQVIFLDFDHVGNPLSILDGIFMAIKDDIDCYPHPSKGKYIPSKFMYILHHILSK